MKLTIYSLIHDTEATLEREEAKEHIDKHNENFGDGDYVAGVKATVDDEPVVVKHPDDIVDSNNPEILKNLS